VLAYVLLAWPHKPLLAGLLKIPVYRTRSGRWTHNLAYVRPPRSKLWRRLSRLNPRSAILAFYNGWRKKREKVPETSDDILNDLNLTLAVNSCEVDDALPGNTLPAVNCQYDQTMNSFIRFQHSAQSTLTRGNNCQQSIHRHRNSYHKSFIADPSRHYKNEKSSQTEPVVIKPIPFKCNKSTSTQGTDFPTPTLSDSSSPASCRMYKMLTRRKHRSFSHKFVPSTNSDMLHGYLFCGSYKPRQHESMGNLSFIDNVTVPAAPTPTEKEIERR